MVIFRNIPQAIKIARAYEFIRKPTHDIIKAREAGDIAGEKAAILESTSKFSKNFLEIFDSNLYLFGEENKPTEGPVLYVSNHQGYADIVALMAALDTIQFGFVAKKELVKVPVYGKWLAEIRCVLMDRTNARTAAKAISQGIDYLKNGYSLLLFPEGTRSHGPEMGEFLKGSLKLATKTKVPIVPVSVQGSYYWYEKTGIVTPHDLGVTIHPPVETKNLSHDAEHALPASLHETLRLGVETMRKIPELA